MKIGDVIVSRINFKDRLTDGKCYVIINDDGDKNSFYTWAGKLIIILGDNSDEFRFYDRNLNNYFYTEQEIRKLKLKKLEIL